MITPRVVLKSRDDEQEYEMNNLSVSPYTYERDISFPENNSEDTNNTYTFELVSNGKFLGKLSKITVLSQQGVIDLVNTVNSLESNILWGTFEDNGQYEPLDPGTVTVPALIERVSLLESICGWGTFSDDTTPVPYGDDFQTLLTRISRINDSVTWS